jgi:hypothetical protein
MTFTGLIPLEIETEKIIFLLCFSEHILDEAKVILAVSYIKGIPVPDEIKVSVYCFKFFHLNIWVRFHYSFNHIKHVIIVRKLNILHTNCTQVKDIVHQLYTS